MSDARNTNLYTTTGTRWSEEMHMPADEWDRLGQLEADGAGPWADWHYAMAALMRAVDLNVADAADGLWPAEQVALLESRVAAAMAHLRAAAVAGEEAMAP